VKVDFLEAVVLVLEIVIQVTHTKLLDNQDQDTQPIQVLLKHKKKMLVRVV
jgi:hypothetical protein